MARQVPEVVDLYFILPGRHINFAWVVGETWLPELFLHASGIGFIFGVTGDGGVVIT